MQESFFADQQEKTEYEVLARKYRPYTFEDLIGQQALVQTLSNAIEMKRIAHAFVLTGIRGIGKTTTARIIAKALNCIGEDGQGGPTIKPCCKCTNCLAITEDRHQDVIEVDAASNTSVDNIRELLDNAKYKPISARYKIFVIDEVHMLSRSAFNALLKTLEEPPAHVKFIFATTEIHKIPVTILSRCQRFDLRRISAEQLAHHLNQIAQKEGVELENDAAIQISLAAEGSARDALSILDQAISHAHGKVVASEVRKMLGMANRLETYKLYATLVKGNLPQTLRHLEELVNSGAEPSLLLQDILETTHQITRFKVLDISEDASMSAEEIKICKQLADDLSLILLSRIWQMLLKGANEIKLASDTPACLEMLLVRISHMSLQPLPEEIIHKARKSAANTQTAEQELAAAKKKYSIDNVRDIASLCFEEDELLLHHHLVHDIAVIEISAFEVLVCLKNSVDKTIITSLEDLLKSATGHAWQVRTESMNPEAKTIAEEDEEKRCQLRTLVSSNFLVTKALSAFNGAEIEDIEIKL
jgi:DNA polymerase-3 subunit gamma/tau